MTCKEVIAQCNAMRPALNALKAARYDAWLNADCLIEISDPVQRCTPGGRVAYVYETRVLSNPRAAYKFLMDRS
jgi:hypothetical protein